MTTDAVPASAVPIPAPCSADWSAMGSTGAPGQRFCDQCQHSVTDLSDLSRDEALKRLEQPDICVRYRVDRDENIVFATASTVEAAVEAADRPFQTGRSTRSAVTRRLARWAVLAAGIVSTPALADIPEAEASAASHATPSTAPTTEADADGPSLMDRLWTWLGALEEPAGPTTELDAEPIPEVSTHPGGIVPDPVDVEADKPDPRPIRMGRIAVRKPVAPASTQGQPATPSRSPAAPR